MSEDEFISVLIEEMRVKIKNMEDNLILIEEFSDNIRAVQEVKLGLHSMKGLFAYLDEEYSSIRVLTHQLEDRFNSDPYGSINHIRVYLHQCKVLIELINNTTKIDVDLVFQDLYLSLNPGMPEERLYRINVAINPKSEKKIARMLSLINRMARLGKIIKSVPDESELLSIKDFDHSYIDIITKENKYIIINEIVKIAEITSYEIEERSIADMLEEKVILRSQRIASKVEIATDELQQLILSVDALMNLEEYNHDKIYAELDCIRHKMISFKQLPVEIILKQLPKIVAKLSKKLNKPVDLRISGGEININRDVLQIMSDVLLVLIHNSMTHGIDAASKESIISITVTEEDNNWIFEIADNGKGIDAGKIWNRGIELGLIDQYDEFSREIALSLVFLSGFTDIENTSIISGRGMGLSSVKKDLQSINGTINLQSINGTKITISIPIE